MTYLTMWITVLTIFILSVGLMGWSHSRYCPFNGMAETIGGIGALLTLIYVVFGLILGPIFAHYNQIKDVENITSHKQKIQIQQDRLDRLSTILEKFNYPDAQTLANSDAPIGSVVDQMSEVQADIADRRESIANLKSSIRQRAAWIFSFTTKWYPLEQ